jgi:hypothetical protein
MQALIGAPLVDLEKLLGQPDAKKAEAGNEVWTYQELRLSAEGAKLDQNFLVEKGVILFEWQEEPK